MKTTDFLNSTASFALGVKNTEGDKYGIELELEGRNVGLRDIPTKGWQRHADGSLRGESIEYTTTGAKPLPEAKSLVVDLFKKFKENGVEFRDSIRTSTHVHLNFSDKPLKQAINFFCLFTMMEEMLCHYSGEDRKGNLFCISTRDAEAIVGVLHSSIAKGSLDRFAGDRYKYAACNLSTLYKFGTIEVRTMRGATSDKQVNAWLDILDDMYKYATTKMKSPVELVRDLSFLGAEGFLRKVFKEANYRELTTDFVKVRPFYDSLMEGARIIQLLAFEFEEAFNIVVEVKKPGKNALPFRIQEGPWAGSLYTIYRPDGHVWNVSNPRARPRAGGFWQDGDKAADDERIEWSEERQRFIVRYGPGDVVECRWARHHRIHDEGMPPAEVRRQMPRWVNFEPAEEEEEADDWLDDIDEEI